MAGNLHGRILQCLQQDLIETEVKDMINYCADATDERIKLTRRQVQGMVSILEFINQLSLRGKIKKNQNYDALLQILDDLKIVDPAEKVRSIIAEAAPDCRPTHSDTGVSTSNGHVSSSSSPHVNIKKRKMEKSFSGESVFGDGLDTLAHYRLFEGGSKALVVLVNIEFKVDSPMHRKGSTQDTDRLRGLFTSDSLRDYYDVMEERNITKLRLIRLLQLVRSETQRRKYCALFLFILTHGEKDTLHMYFDDESEDYKMPVDDVTNEIKDLIPGLPKVLIMQACQGVEDIVMADSVSADDTGEELMEVEADHVLVPGPLHDADLLIAYSTIKDRRSYREDDGSWYIKHLIEVISQYNMSDHLVDILTETQHRVTKRIGLISTGSQADQTFGNDLQYKRVRQVPAFQSTLRKKLYLRPM